MLSKMLYDGYIELLQRELVPSLGCTEPIAVALAAAMARKILGKEPEKAELICSGNIIKNVKGVIIPRTAGMKGIDVAAIAGFVAGTPDLNLQVLETVQEKNLPHIRELLASGMCTVKLARGVENLFIDIMLTSGEDQAEVQISGSHSNISYMTKNGHRIFGEPCALDFSAAPNVDSKCNGMIMNLQSILSFTEMARLEDIHDVIYGQITMNTAISKEGMGGDYGVSVGRMLLDSRGSDVRNRARAKAAAGSDARMSGCSLPVVINSGSGNQGITVSVPVIEYAKELNVSEDMLYRALILSNLVSIHIKSKIGKLSAFCGAVSAAAGCGAGIEYLHGGGYDEIAKTVKNTLANVSGIVCDGAKPSCAAKIASAVDAAIMAHDLTARGHVFGAGEGLIEEDLEKTLENIGRLGKIGMRGTDEEILAIMTRTVGN